MLLPEQHRHLAAVAHALNKLRHKIDQLLLKLILRRGIAKGRPPGLPRRVFIAV